MEDFIAVVKQYPCLWNTKLKEYHDHTKKEDAWLRIVATINDEDIQDIQTVKAEWKKLRDCHRDSLKRAKRRSGGVNTWKYTKSMNFLLPFMKTRQRRRLFVTPKRNSSSNTNSPASVTVKEEVSSDEEITVNLDTSQNDSSNRVKQNRTRKRKLDTVHNEFVEVEIDDKYKRLREEKDELRVTDNEPDQTTTDNHALDTFFESMCATTKQFPMWLQNSVKRKIFKVVSEAEDTYAMSRYSSPFITKVQSITP